MIAAVGRAFGRISIKWKITGVLGLLITIGFCVAGVGMFIDYRSSFRQTIQNKVSILAEVVGNNCRAALVFQRPDDAHDTLQALAANSHIIDATLFDHTGREFAAYSQFGKARTPESVELEPKVSWGEDILVVRRLVRLDGRKVGLLEIRSDAGEWRSSLARFVRVAVVLFLSVMLLTVLAAAFLQRLITDSLSDLVATTRKISETKDFTLRASCRTEDEVGELVVAFNAMLREIGHRDEEIRSARDELGRHVEELEFHESQLRKSNQALKREVREREQAERKLAQHATALKASNHELEQFAYVTSHDLQEPLRGIAGSLQLLEKKYGDRLDDDARTLMGFAVDGANRLKRLIDGLLKYARVNTRSTEFRDVDCELLRKQVLSDLAVAIVEAEATVTSDPLPTIRADETQLPLVFQNLVSNAIRFRTDEALRIHLGAERKGDAWVFSVEDNGIGIEPRFTDRIFEIFQRLHGRDEYDGTGIGLAIAKKVVDRHNGKIWVEPANGRGARFCFSIPQHEGQVNE